MALMLKEKICLKSISIVWIHSVEREKDKDVNLEWKIITINFQ